MAMPSLRIFYGWWVTLAFSAMVFVSTGVRFTVGPFLKPMVGDLGLDRSSYSLAIAVGLFLYGAFIPLVGWVVDRIGARPVTIAGVLLLAGATGGTALATSLWHLYVLWGVVMALGLAGTGHVVASAVIARWFTQRRATALSVLGGASMAGMSMLVPVATWLIIQFGWRVAHGVIAAGLLVLMLPLTLWVVRESPESMGLAPDGGAAAAGAPAAGADRTAVGAAVQTASFWQLGGALGTCGFTMALLGAHGVPMLTDHGYTPMLASWALALLGGSSVLFSVVLGALGDRVGCRPVLAWVYGSRALLLVGLFAIRDNPVALLVLSVLGGATMAGTLAMTSALTATIFGRYSVGAVLGTMFFVHQTGAALGSWLGGALFEHTGGYGAAFALGAAVLALAAVVTLLVDERACAPRLRPVTDS